MKEPEPVDRSWDKKKINAIEREAEAKQPDGNSPRTPSSRVPDVDLNLLFRRNPFLFQRDLCWTCCNTVESSVRLDVFDEFISSPKTQTKISVTKRSAGFLSLLGKAFFLPELATECVTFAIPVDPSSSVLILGLHGSSFSNPLGKIGEKIESHERRLESLRQEFERKEGSIDRKVAVIG
jgi:hypothetical protein